MLWKNIAGAVAVTLILSSPAWADSDKADSDKSMRGHDKAASIPFADYRGRIRDWRAQGRDAILIQSDSGQWYRATFMSSCHNLPFSETIGFVMDGTRQINKFSSIVVRGAGNMVEECWFSSFEELPGPGPE